LDAFWAIFQKPSGHTGARGRWRARHVTLEQQWSVSRINLTNKKNCFSCRKKVAARRSRNAKCAELKRDFLLLPCVCMPVWCMTEFWRDSKKICRCCCKVQFWKKLEKLELLNPLKNSPRHGHEGPNVLTWMVSWNYTYFKWKKNTMNENGKLIKCRICMVGGKENTHDQNHKIVCLGLTYIRHQIRIFRKMLSRVFSKVLGQWHSKMLWNGEKPSALIKIA
jgi:hypothetical protein